MATREKPGTLLRGIPFPILATVAILWITAAHGLIDSGPEWVDYTARPDGNTVTAVLLFILAFAHFANALLGLGIQLRLRWARSTAIGLCLFRTATASFALVGGDTPSYTRIALNLVIVVLLLLPSSAAWCDRP
ncbi:hypothetical protein [Glycomyces xiaoerkulensis]|uniref:hypothetical protein n=1 Tax=Glycomyces xiaoerkulensis TaxID=2038139 RepID=UPI000C25B1F0|nr:hypothetical protein [Glycomyces xiaoerkulensis]